MLSEKRRAIAKFLSLVVIVAGLLVIVGWIFDIGFLKSIVPSLISMKFDSAIAFVLSGITLYFITRAREGEFDKAQVVLSITSLIIILLMGLLLFSSALRIHTGIEDLFVTERAGGVKTVVPGRPSVPAMFNFILIAAAGILTILNPHNLKIKLKIIGVVVWAIGATAIVGYIFNSPHLYYYIEGINSAIAFHTAVLCVLLGIGLLCL
jgi:hypothetical protein